MVVLVIAKWLTWWGGHSWGPRLLADITPIMCFFLYPLTPLMDRRRLLKIVFLVLALASIGAHALGAWLYDGRWDGLSANQLRARLWSWNEGPLAFYGREALLPLQRLVRIARSAGHERRRAGNARRLLPDRGRAGQWS